MIDLQPLCIELGAELKRYLIAEGSRSSDYCFANMFMWDEKFNQSVAICGDRLITLLSRGAELFFTFPIGSGDIGPALSFMREYSYNKGIPFRMCGVTDEHLSLLRSVCPDEFDVTEDSFFSDYIYTAEALSSYSGRHLHAKRNFCNRFTSEYSWSYVPLTKELIPDCISMFDEWIAQGADRLMPDIAFERSALLRCFENMDELGLFGGVLYANGKLSGFSVGEMIRPDTFCVHFEKAFTDIYGAYPMLCRETVKLARSMYPDVYYVNREEDMGNPALRASKLSYKPHEILTKYILSEK